jgi:hypothetical protein
MAGLGCDWTKSLAVAVLLIGTGTVGFSQSDQESQSSQSASSGSLAGKLTDLHSKPLAGVTVVLRNQATGAETARATTTKNGAYRFSGLAPGEYTLEAESPQLGHGQVEGIVVDAGHEARVQTAMEFAPLAPSPVLTAMHGEEPPKVEARPRINRPVLEPEMLPLSDAALAAEPLLLLPLSGRRIRAELLQTTTLPLNATLATEALQTLALSGRSWQVSTQPAAAASTPALAVANGSQVSEARPGAPAQTPLKPVPAATQQSGPVSPAVSATMSAAELQALPVSGRRWQDFVLDNTPTSATPAGGQAQISLRGAGQQPAEFAVDGVGMNLAFGPANGSGQGSSGQGPLGQGGAGPAGMAQVGAGGHGLAISEAAIRALQTAAGNVEAAEARAVGGRMNVQTESGANELHGQGFFFDRQNTWGARNPFTQWITETSEFAPFAQYNSTQFPVFDNFQYSTEPPVIGPPESYTPPDHETTWGIGVGGRIRRDKLFWFAALDGYHRNDAGLSMVKHPYLVQTLNNCVGSQCTETTGFFATPSDPELQVLCERLGITETVLGKQVACPNPLVEALTAYSSMLEKLAGLLGPAPRTARQWTGFSRLDWQAAERHRFTLEGIGADWNSPGGGLTRVSETYGNHSFGSSEASEEWLLGRWEAFLTPNLLAVTQASTGRTIQEARPSTPSAFEQTFLTGNAYGQLPEIVVDNRYGFTVGNPSRFGTGSYPDEHLYHGQESVDWIRGNLLVRAGFEVNHNSDEISLLRNQTGTYTYSNVENFVSDALAFQNFPTDPLDPLNLQHNCDVTGTGVGYLPCYSYFSQTMGPPDWHLSTNDWAGYTTAQWQANKLVVLSAGLRWEREQRPPPLAALKNPELPLTETLPALGNNWAPRLGLAVGTGEKHWPVLRLGYGIYYGRTENLTLETALTQTGSLNGDLSFFMRPTDDEQYYAGGAPPFPYVLAGVPGSAIKPGAVEFAGIFRNPEVNQAVAAVEETLPGHVEVTASAMVSLGRRLPISIDTNLDPTLAGTITYAVVDPIKAADPTKGGPIKATQITVPFYASWPGTQGVCPYPTTGSVTLPGRPCPDYQQITNIESRANSTYEAGMLKVERFGRRGLTLHAHYIYGHAMDWNPNESAEAAGNDVLDPSDFSLEYGVSDQDIRHSFGAMAIYETPWKLTGRAGKFANGWMLSGILQARSGLPYTMRPTGSLAKCFASSGESSCTPPNLGSNTIISGFIVGLGPGMNGSGGDNRVYGAGNDNIVYNIGRNTYRYPGTWKADLRLGKRFDLGKMRQLELLAESFNLLNHQNVTELETTGYYLEPGSTDGALPTLNFLTGLKANTTAFGQPLNINATNFYRERQFQFGLRMRF